MSWAGENNIGGVSGLYIYTEDGSPGTLTGNTNEVVVWSGGIPAFTPQIELTGVSGSTTLQNAYDVSSGPPQITLNAPGTLSIRDAPTPAGSIFEIQDNAGVPQHFWTPTSVNMGPAVTDIFAASLAGVNITPTLFPTRPTINITLDQLKLLPSARTITSNFTKIEFSDTYTLDFVNASFGAALGVTATILLRQNGGPFGMGLLFNNGTTWSNDTGFAVNLGSAFSFVDQPTYRADGQVVTQPVVRSMISQPVFSTINGGSLSTTTLQHYYAAGRILTGASLVYRICFEVFNPTVLTGTITGNHVGLRIANLTDGGGGATIRGITSLLNNGLFLEQLGTAPSEHLSEFRIGSTLAHIGDTDTNIAFTTDQVNINASGVNLIRAFANGVGNFVSINPNAGDVDFFVNGDTITGLIRTEASIDGLGFHGVTPVPLSAAYTVTSGNVDRSYNADATTINEIADVLGTLISDLQAKGVIG